MDDYAEDLLRGEQPVSSQQPSEHIPVTSKDLSVVLDVVHALATTTASLAASQTALAERMARTEVTLA